MSNNSSLNRFRRITVKAIIMLLAVVMSLSVLPALSAEVIPAVSAADAETFDVYAADLALINGKLAGYAQGTVVNLTLYTDINFTNGDAEIYDNGFTGIIIPAGITVNLFMNGKSLSFVRTENGAYRLPYVYGIHNKGTLNLYSGAKTTAVNNNADITLINFRNGQTCTDERGTVYCELEAIRNEGALTVNRGVNIYVETHNEFDDVSGSDSSINVNYTEQIANAGTGIYNIGNATCQVNGAVINAVAYGHTIYRLSNNEESWGCNTTAAAYGIYGGYITVSGGAKISTTSHASSRRQNCTGSSKDDGRSKITGVAYGIVSDKSVTVTGADIAATATTSSDDALTHNSSAINSYAAGVYTKSGVVPYMPDVSIIVKSSSLNPDDNYAGAINYREGTVVTSSSLPASSEAIVSSNRSYNATYKAWPSSAVEAGSFSDEVGNIHTTDIITSNNGNHPISIVRGALEGTTRVHVVYRYWKNDSLSELDTSVVDKNGNKGYTYFPLDNDPLIVKTPATFEGIAGNSLVVRNGDLIGYKDGGQANNEHYWDFCRLSYDKVGKETFDQVDILKPGTEFVVFEDGISDKIEATGGSLFIYVDYIRKPVSYVKAVTPSQIVKTTYTGTNINATDIGLKIVDSYVQSIDYTDEYNFAFEENSNRIPVEFSYIGTNAAGVEEKSESGKLPVNAGIYTVTLHIADSTVYDHNPDTNKNRKGVEFVFQLNIEPAPVLRGNLTREVSVLYGQKLSEVIDFTKYAPVLLGSDSGVKGTYSFESASDGDTCKNVGSGVVNVVWTPADDGSVLCKNYAPTVFEIKYTVGQGVIEIYPEAATIVYGDSDNGDVFSAKVKGLADKDDTESVKKILSDRIVYSIIVDNKETVYTAGNIPAGEYVIRAKFDSTNLTGSLTNYRYVCKSGADNPEGVLTVEKRGLTVVVAGQQRGYEPGNFSINVNFNITDGKFNDDDVAVSSITTTIDDNYVGQHVFNYEGMGEVIGEKAANYFIEKVNCASQDGKHYVYITKGIPDVKVPSVADMFYTQDRLLSQVSLNTSTPAVAGVWEWVNPDINPTVNVKSYQAKFVPDNKEVYDVKLVDIAINVKPTDVVISYNADIVYGDDIPDIMDFTYTADNDPGFSIDGVKTSGNIIPQTSYKKGDPVKAGGYVVEIAANDYFDMAGNYNFTAENGIITVNPKEIVFKVEDKEIYYLDSFSVNNVKVTFDENLLVGTDTETDLTSNGALPSFTISSTYDEQNKYDVGVYTLDAHLMSSVSPNYNIVIEKGSLTVKKAPLTIEGKNISLVYGSAVPADLHSAFTLVGVKRAETLDQICAGTIGVTTEYTAGSSVTADGYAINIDISDASFKNYEVSVVNGKITVLKATPVISVLPSAQIYHGQTLADAVFNGGITDVPGKFVYEYPTIEPGYKDGTYDSFKADFVPDDTTNYNVVSGNIVILTVEKSEITGIVAVSGVPMVGQTLIADASGLIPADAGYTFTWYDSNGNTLGTGAQFTLAAEDSGKAVYVTAVPDADSIYYGSVSSDRYVITSGLTDIREILTSAKYQTYFSSSVIFGGVKEVIYNNEKQAVAFAGKDGQGVGNVVVKYNGSTEAPTDAGTYTITVDIGAGSVYSPICNFTIGTLRISPRVCNVVVEIIEKTYDGTTKATAKVIGDIAALGEDKVSFVADAVTYTFDTPDAGTGKTVYAKYTDCLTGEDAENYKAEIVISNATSAVINKKPLTVKVTPVEREYQDKNFDVDLDFSFTPVTGDENLVYVNRANAKGTIVGYLNGKDNGVGEHDVDITGVELAGSKAKNYEISYNKTAKVTIVAATPVYSVPEISGELYYDSTRTLKQISLGNTNWSWADDTIVPQAGAHYYKASYTPSDSNYATVEYDIKVEILKKAVTVTAESFTVSYGDIAPTFRYTVKGLTGNDTIEDNVNGYVRMSSEYAAGTVVGSYVIEISGTLSSDNYEFTYVNGQLTVTKRAAYVDVIAVDRPYAPGNSEVEVTFSELSNLYSGDIGDVRLSKSSTTGKIAGDGAGKKSVQYTIPALAGEKAANYMVMPKNADVSVDITKAAVPGVVLPTTGELYYGYSLVDVKFTSGVIDPSLGRFEMENPNETINKLGTFSNIYKVVFTPVDTENYATVSEYVTLTVLPADISGSLYFTGKYKSGETLEVNLRKVPEGAWMHLNVTWYRVDSPDDAPESGVPVASNTRTYTLKDDDSGKFIICSVQNGENSPYHCNAVCVSDYEIEERQRSFFEKIIDWFYKLLGNFTELFANLF